MRRIRIHALAAACLPLALLGTAHAQSDWPQKSVKLVVPYAPGGTSDTLGRVLAEHLSTTFKQPFVVENRAGAGGTLGSAAVAKAPPDGYTLLVSGIGSHVIAPVLQPVAFHPLKDFTHVAMLGGPPLAMVVNAQVPIRDVKEFVSHVSASPKGLSWGSPGLGTHGHLVGQVFADINKLNMVHIGYKGAAPAMNDLLGNQIPAAFMTFTTANAHIKSGKVRGLAVSAPDRLADYPDLPTFAEAGFPKLTSTTWFSISGPANMPKAIVEKLNVEIRRSLRAPAVQRQLAMEGIDAPDWEVAVVQQYYQAEIERWTPVIKALDGSKH